MPADPQEPDAQTTAPAPMTAQARLHRRIILAVMLLFCAIPLFFIFLKLTSREP